MRKKISNIKYGRIQSIDKTIKRIKCSPDSYMEVINNIITFENGEKHEIMTEISEYKIGQEIVFLSGDEGTIRKIFKREDQEYYKTELKKEKYEHLGFSIAIMILPLLLSGAIFNTYLTNGDPRNLAFLISLLSICVFIGVFARREYQKTKKLLKERKEAFDTLEKESISGKDVSDIERVKNNAYQNIIN